MSVTFDPKDLVLFIVWFAKQRGERLTTLRLVKFLYLADLYFARENGGRTLTGWPWAFVHYGPFCGDALDTIQEALSRGEITAQKFKSKYDDRDFHIYDVPDEQSPAIRDNLPMYVVGNLQEAIRKWADDTPSLLDHVYFHTEPMIDARPGERLDFSRAIKYGEPRSIAMVRLPPLKIKRARAAARALAERYKKGTQAMRVAEAAAIYDASFSAAMEAMEETSRGDEGEITGTAQISES